MRKIFSKLHLWLSIPFGAIISAVCLSGAALVFEKELSRILYPELYRVEVREQAQPLPPSEVVRLLRMQLPDTLQISTLQISGNPEETWKAGFANVRRKTVSINPYTGEITGWGAPLFQGLRKFHRWLMDAPLQREPTVGKNIVGISTLSMVVILLSGLFIWIPRNRRALKNRLRVSCTKGWRRFWYDSHVSLGFYTALFLLVMALTGLTWSFSWYRTAAYAIFGESTQSTAGHTVSSKNNPKRGNRQQQKEEKEQFDYTVWDYALAETQQAYLAYNSIKLEWETIEVAPDPESNIRKIDKVKFDRQTGRLGDIIRYRDLPPSQTLKEWFYAFHTGSWGGMWTKILYFFSALIGGTLPLSGYYLWYKRRFPARRKQ